MLTEADDYAWVPLGDVLLAIMDPDAGEVAYPEGTKPVISTALLAGLALPAALRDMAGAYHHERSHAGSWDECQRPRCQSARLALEGRGPFALLPTQASDSPEKP